MEQALATLGRFSFEPANSLDAPDTTPPQVLIVFVRENDRESLDIIRYQRKRAAASRIVAMSTFDVRSAACAAGCDVFLEMPFSLQTFFDALGPITNQS